MDDDLEDFKKWLDTFRNADGTINKSHLPEICKSLGWIPKKNFDFKKIPDLGLGKTVNFDFKNAVRYKGGK